MGSVFECELDNCKLHSELVSPKEDSMVTDPGKFALVGKVADMVLGMV